MINGRTVVLCAALSLAACHGSDSNQAPVTGVNNLPAKVPQAAKRGPTPEELTAGMVEAVGVGKSSVPVTLKFDLPSRPEIGQPLEIVLGVLPQEPAAAASLTVSGSEGLRPAPGNGVVDVGAVDPAEAYRVTVTVTPTAEGVQFLAVDVALKHDDVTDTRSFSIPIIVQGAAEAGATPPAAATTAKH